MSQFIQKSFPKSIVRKAKLYDHNIQSSPLRALLKKLGMACQYSHEKVIPKVVFDGGRDVLIGFIQGLFDTDGTASRLGEVSYCTTSSRLSREVQSVLLALGIRTTRTFKANYSRGAWILTCQEEDNFGKNVGFRLARKQSRTQQKGKFYRARSSYPPSLLSVIKRLRETRKDRGVGSLSRKTHKHVIDSVLRQNTSLSARRISPVMDVLNGWNDAEFQKYWLRGDVWWDKVADCHPVQCPLVDICVPQTQNFIGNGFINHNTVGALHCVAEHAWLTDPCNVGMVTISQTVGLDSGIWRDFTNHTLPEWIGTHYDGRPWEGRDAAGNPIEGGNFGMEWVKAPYIQGVSKKPTVEVSNCKGGVSVIQLNSLQDESKVEDLFKPRRYSMIYMPELSTFHERKTFDTLTESLRMLGLPADKHLFLGDTNPPDDESWWIHDLWWDLIECPEDLLDEFIKDRGLPLTVEELKALRNDLFRVDINVEDNPFADPKHVQLLRAKYAHNDELYRRYIKGECVRTTADSLFHEVFRPTFHIVGDPKTKTNPNPEMMYPEEDCIELLTDWDPGSTTNWAAHIVEKFYPSGQYAEKYAGKPCFKILDECMVIDEDVDAPLFIHKMLEKMDFWQNQISGRVINWRHWSDESVFSMKDIGSGKYYQQIIYEISQGEIELMGAEKKPGSLRAGIDLLRRLLWEERIWINNATCPVTIAAFKGIKRGKSDMAVIQKGTPHKHPIDAFRYLVQSECYDELERAVFLNFRKRKREIRSQQSPGRAIAIGL